MNIIFSIKMMGFSIVLLIFFSCKSKLVIERPQEEAYISYKRYVIDTSCQNIDIDNCEFMVQCHYSRFMSTDYPFIFDLIDNKNKVGDLLDCSVTINQKKDSLYNKTNMILSHYFLSHIRKSKINNGSLLISGIFLHNRFYRLLSQWNTEEAFNICMQLSSKNIHDSMGDGDCTNLSVDFINTIVLPKIKTIEGMDFWAYFEKHNHGDHGSADCYDSMYEAIYPMLKKAWDEGKIVLKTDE